jgi:hypothetical protein
MPLIVGIVNGPDKGFSSEEISFINSFGIGVLSMAACVGRVDDPEQFHQRMWVTNQVTGIFNFLPSWFTVEFCGRLQAADWSANVTTESHTIWKNRMKQQLWDTELRDYEKREEYEGSCEEE